ncbi:hypothetical protein GCM10026983_21140 [Gracilibacillus alcaliphilus]
MPYERKIQNTLPGREGMEIDENKYDVSYVAAIPADPEFSEGLIRSNSYKE